MAKEEKKERDVYDVEFYYSKFSPEVEQSFNFEQKQAVKTVIKSMIRIPSKKVIDFRTTFWFLTRLYIVVFIGIDKRKRTVGFRDYEDNISTIRFCFKLIVYASQLLILLVFALFIIYLLKSIAGINIFKDKHLIDVIREFI